MRFGTTFKTVVSETIRCTNSKGKCYFGKFYIQIYIQVSVCIVGLTVKHIYCGSWAKLSTVLYQGLGNFFCKGPGSEYF